MNPLIAIAATVFPEILKSMAGDKAGVVATQVLDTVKEVTGTDDPAQAKRVVEDDPKAVLEMRSRLAEIALAELKVKLEAEQKARDAAFADADKRRASELAADRQSSDNTKGARDMFSALAIAQTPAAWVGPLLSMIVTLGFFAMVGMFVVAKPDLTGADGVTQVLNICVGAVAAAFATVMNFWLGSSQGSRAKDALVADLQAQASTQAVETLKQASDVVTTGGASIKKLPSAGKTPSAAGAAPVPSSAQAGRSKDRFDECIKFVLQYEGGYSNHPKDPGGPTKLGITLATLEHWRGDKVTAQDVQDLSVEEACEIYRANYWDTMRCGLLPAGVDLMVFDFGVNAGPRRSIQLLQKAAGADADGAIGPITLQAVNAQEPKDLMIRMAGQRMAFYQGLKTFGTFGKGWASRVEAAQREALRMIAEDAGNVVSLAA
jgi:lysozyme family protein